jgi:biotin-independent malonate decarboxylase gamma subunit
VSERSRGRVWLERLASGGATVSGLPPSVLAADDTLDGVAVRWIAVVPDPNARFERARDGEMGIDEGFGVAQAVASAPAGSAIVAIVDIPGQAFGLREEAIGLQRALAAPVWAYVRARRAGHPVGALVVGKAISGAFLAHGLQAGWIGALNDRGVEVHVMSEPAVARVTRMERSDLARVAREIPATARDIVTFARFGGIDRLFDVADPCDPSSSELAAVSAALATALRDPRIACRNPKDRLDVPAALQTRALSRRVRHALDSQWDE